MPVALPPLTMIWSDAEPGSAERGVHRHVRARADVVVDRQRLEAAAGGGRGEDDDAVGDGEIGDDRRAGQVQVEPFVRLTVEVEAGVGLDRARSASSRWR